MFASALKTGMSVKLCTLQPYMWSDGDAEYGQQAIFTLCSGSSELGYLTKALAVYDSSVLEDY